MHIAVAHDASEFWNLEDIFFIRLRIIYAADFILELKHLGLFAQGVIEPDSDYG